MDGPLNGLARRIAWGDTSASPPTSLPEMIRPRIGDEIELVLLDGAAVPIWLHWTGRRSVPHLVGPTPCPLCNSAEPAKLYAYISAWHLRKNVVGLAEITAYGIGRCPEILQPSEARPLRGRHAMLARAQGHRSARCLIRLLEATRPEPLPKGLNVHHVLEHLWGWDPQTRAALGLGPIADPPKKEEESED